MKKVIKTIALILFLFPQLQSQETITFQSYLFDENENPIQEAFIYTQSSNKHTHSDQAGLFKLANLNENDSLIVSALGFNSIVIPVAEFDYYNENAIVLIPLKIDLSEVLVTPGVRLERKISKLDLKTFPVNSSQEIMTLMPGLFIGQHAGGGKAEQIFLRGFDIDHGTDIALSIDGMPINMVSHAHGQGYSDLHFIIPEIISTMNYGTGLYDAEYGNFATAGHIAYKTFDRINQSSFSTELGQFGTNRNVVQVSLIDKKQHSAYIAGEYRTFDGPYESPQNFSRANVFGKYLYHTSHGGKLGLSASYFTSEWTASGQIPLRAIENGLITRWGAIDDTEGGTTSRTNINVEYSKVLPSNGRLTANAFYSRYTFDLFSNFTFFLDDPINGDQIRQIENRDLFGFNTAWNKTAWTGDISHWINLGIGSRHDRSLDNALIETVNRYTNLNYTQRGNISENNYYTYISDNISFGQFSLLPSLRFDYFDNAYLDLLEQNPTKKNISDVSFNPKLTLTYNPVQKLQLFGKVGYGFHNNDTRIALNSLNNSLVTSAFGSDLGFVFKPTDDLMINSAIWHLKLDEELVYVGDEGVVEPSGESVRYGVDLTIRAQFTKWLSARIDGNYSRGRIKTDNGEEELIPLAPRFTSLGFIQANHPDGWFGGIKYRFMGDRPANEDNSIVAEGYFITDINLGKSFGKVNAEIIVENIFDRDWKETQFATESRLQNEDNPVEEIHFIPGTPFFLRGKISYSF